ncbi:MAG: DNA-binding protein, partial [Sandaracinaceae bacterium]|nr:DNA-binding protein [Sandaracinaceae bacterium]
MKAVLTGRQRRFFVRLGAGQDVVASIESLAHREGIHAAWVRGVGALERAELEHAALEEPCEILSLAGSLRWRGDEPRPRLRVALAPLSDGGRLLGGVLRRAPATDVELLVEAFDDVPLELVEAASVSPRIKKSVPAPEPAPPSWAEAARASA